MVESVVETEVVLKEDEKDVDELVTDESVELDAVVVVV